MYLSGSKWNMKKKRPRSNPWRVMLLVMIIAALIYVERIIVPVVPPFFVPTPTATESPVTYASAAENQFRSGKLLQAEQSYLQAIAINPEEAAFYIELARIQVYAGKYEQAEINARNALLLGPDSPRARAVLGWVLDFRAGQVSDPQRKREMLQEALEWIEKALEVDPNSALAHAYYAEVLMDNGLENYPQARQEAETAIALSPNILEGYRALGYVYELTANYNEAINSYSTALSLNPNLSILEMALGNMYLAIGNIEQALQHYIAASTLAPNDVVPLQRLAQANARIGEFGKAGQYARQAMLLNPANPNLHGELGRMYYKNNDLPAAIKELGLAIHGGEKPAEWTVGGRLVLVTQNTRIEGEIKLGDEVIISVESAEGGAYEALRIDLRGASISDTPGLQSGQQIAGVVEAIIPSVIVPGLALNPGDARVVEFYYTYSLALAKQGQCELARDIAQALLIGARENEFAVVNAEETIKLCAAFFNTPTPAATATPTR